MHPETIALILWTAIVALAVVWRFRQNDRTIRHGLNPPPLRPVELFDQDAPLDPRDVRLWCAQILEPDSDQRIITEADK